MMFWLLGSVAGASWADLRYPAVAIALTAAWLLTQGRPMNALAIGDDTAAGLGVDVNRLRILLLVAASLLTATVVSVAGGIGFVGLIVPHAVRLVVGTGPPQGAAGVAADRRGVPGAGRPRHPHHRPAERDAHRHLHRRTGRAVLPGAAAQPEEGLR